MVRFKFAWLVLTLASVVVLQSPVSAGPGSANDGVIDVLKDVLGITDLEEENAAQQLQINALLTEVGNINVLLAMKCDEIEDLQAGVDDLETRVGLLECQVDCPEPMECCGDPAVCVDTQTDEDNCGECGTQCPSGEQCVMGVCAAPPCEAVDDCHVAVVMDDGMMGQTCTQVAVADDTACEDGQFCTMADTCQNGVCVGGPVNCAPGETCNEITDMCEAP